MASTDLLHYLPKENYAIPPTRDMDPGFEIKPPPGARNMDPGFEIKPPPGTRDMDPGIMVGPPPGTRGMDPGIVRPAWPSVGLGLVRSQGMTGTPGKVPSKEDTLNGLQQEFDRTAKYYSDLTRKYAERDRKSFERRLDKDPFLMRIREWGAIRDEAEREAERHHIRQAYGLPDDTPSMTVRVEQPRTADRDGSVTIGGVRYIRDPEYQQDAKGGETSEVPIVVEPPSLFDNPPLSSSDAPFPKAWEDEDDAHVSSLVYEATLPASMVNPVDAVGEDGWRKMILSDIEHGGADALAEFRFNWDVTMSPARKAKMLSDVAFGREMTAIVEAAANDVKPLVDPDEYAEQVRMRRARR